MLDHHSLLYIAPSLTVVDDLRDVSSNNPDQTLIESEILSIPEARRIIEMAFQKPIVAPYHTIIVSVKGIADVSQQALLKIVEEPPATTKFIFVVSSLSGLLPTFLSRLHLVTQREYEHKINQEFSDFLAQKPHQRITLLGEYFLKKDVDRLQKLESGLEDWLSSSNKSNPNLAILMYCLSCLRERGAAKKMLWEEIAFSLGSGN